MSRIMSSVKFVTLLISFNSNDKKSFKSEDGRRVPGLVS